MRRWSAEVAAARPWPDDTARRCAKVFADDERPRLLPLPEHPLDTSDRTFVRSAKTLWVRFDRNDYSIPPGAVGKDLVLVATDTNVRIFDGLQEIAHHRRSYHLGERLTDPAHTEALLAIKRGAVGSAQSSPLRLAVPETERFLAAAFPRHRSTALLTTRLSRLLMHTGSVVFRSAD